MKDRRPRVDFVLSREVQEAAAAIGKNSDVAACKAMRGAATRRAIREQQYRTAMQHKTQGTNEPTSGYGATLKVERSAPYANGETKMDTREFIGGTFLKPEDIGPTPIKLTITSVARGKFDKLDLTFDDQSRMGLNNTNGRAIARAWGFESNDWLDKRVELSVGFVTYKGEQQETIVLRPVSPATPETGPIDDIPF